MSQQSHRPPVAGDAGAHVVRAGFMQLVDSAPLIVAAERGFASAEGLRLELSRQTSWANIRDRINIGHLDVAQMLAGMPIASTLGIAHVTVPVLTPFSFGLGGNAIALGRDLFDDLAATGVDWRADARSAATALARVVDTRNAQRQRPLVLGMVFPFSSHNFELRYWLASAGIDPDHDVRLVVIPPPMMVDSMRAGQIDGFCVGEPWASMAVDSGIAAIVAFKQDIWASIPEKVLGVRENWALQNTEVLRRLLRALKRAAGWSADPANREDLIRLLSQEAFVGTPERVLRRILSGDLTVHPDGARRTYPDFLAFGGGSCVPDVRGMMWIYSQMVRWGQVIHSPENESLARGVCRPDLLIDAIGGEATPSGPAGAPFIDGRTFDDNDIAGYVASGDVKE